MKHTDNDKKEIAEAEATQAQAPADTTDAAPETPPIEDPQSNEESPPPFKQKTSRIGVVAFLLALIALGIVGYGYTLIKKMHAEVVSQTNTLAGQLQQSQQAVGNAQRQTGTLEQQLKQVMQQSGAQSNSVAELQDRLTRAMQQISVAGTDSRRDWLLAEVEYLLRLANQRVLLENSPNGALGLLRSADRILRETDDVTLYDVRKALAKDVAALEAVPPLDVDGLFLRLGALNEQVDKLRLLPITDRHQLPSMLKEVTPDNVSKSWQDGMADGWARTLDKLGSLIVVQRRDEPVEPLLSPEQNFFLKQNLHLMLEQSQLALLQGKQQAFDTAINKAHDWVSRYFQAKDGTTQGMLKALSELKGTQVAPTLPDISASLRTLKEYLAARLDGKGAA